MNASLHACADTKEGLKKDVAEEKMHREEQVKGEEDSVEMRL